MWPFQRTLRSKLVDPRSADVQLPPQKPDAPVAFGFNNTWWALPTVDTQAVVSAIRLQNAQPANWQTGVEYAYDRSVFVTPPVKEWTLIVGFRLPPHGEHARSEVVQPLLELSRTFSTALAFSTHHVVEFHVWAKATQGSLIRGYGYLGESGKTLWDEGPMTLEERKLGFAFFDERSSEAKDESYWDREDLDFPHEMDVMAIAREWSISPSDLEEFKAGEQVLGVLGGHSGLLTEDRR